MVIPLVWPFCGEPEGEFWLLFVLIGDQAEAGEQLVAVVVPAMVVVVVLVECVSEL